MPLFHHSENAFDTMVKPVMSTTLVLKWPQLNIVAWWLRSGTVVAGVLAPFRQSKCNASRQRKSSKAIRVEVKHPKN